MKTLLSRFAFTAPAQAAIDLAAEESRRLGHGFVGTEHILLGLLREDSGMAAGVFKTFDLDIARVRAEIEKRVPIGSETDIKAERPLTPRASAAINNAIEEAHRLMQQSIGPEHLLVGLIVESTGVAGVVMRNLGLDPEQLRPVALKVRLMQIKTVERIVRPIRAVTPRKRKMREEILAHLEVICEEEQSRLNDPAAAIAQATRRLGDPAILTRELQSSLPYLERCAYRVDRWYGWRAPESAARYTFRLAMRMGLIVALTFCLALVAVVIRLGWNNADWIAVRPILALLVFAPLDQFLLGFLYFKIRDALWGVCGARQSNFRVALLGFVFASVTLISALGFVATASWDWNRAIEQIFVCLVASFVAPIVCILLARSNGRIEIADALWACLEIDTPNPRIANS